MRKALILLPVFFCLFIAGCYDSTEIDDLAYVVAIGIDKGTDDATLVTFQYAVPLNISGGVDSSGGEGAPLSSVSFETNTVHLAADMANDKMAKITDLSHIKLIVFSEDVAKEGLPAYRTDLREALDIRPDTCLAVCKGKAKNCLSAVSTPLELNPSRYYEDYFSNAESVYSVRQQAGEFFDGKSDFPLPYLTYDTVLQTDGMAIIKNDRMQAHYFAEDAVIYNLLKNEFTDLKFETEEGVFRLDARLPPAFRVQTGDKPNISVSLSLTGEAVTGAELIASSEKAEQVLCTALKKRILNFLYKTQKTDCDILGIGDHAKKNFLTEQGFNAYAWQEKYSKATFDVNISFRCTRRK